MLRRLVRLILSSFFVLVVGSFKKQTECCCKRQFSWGIFKHLKVSQVPSSTNDTWNWRSFWSLKNSFCVIQCMLVINTSSRHQNDFWLTSKHLVAEYSHLKCCWTTQKTTVIQTFLKFWKTLKHCFYVMFPKILESKKRVEIFS